ncbi:hypothetical protein D3C71_463350 [compost metagenome]
MSATEIINQLMERAVKHNEAIRVLRPGQVLLVTTDAGNPHRHPYVEKVITRLAVVSEFQRVFVKVTETARGFKASALRLEERVLVHVDCYSDPVLLSTFDHWKVYTVDDNITEL